MSLNHDKLKQRRAGSRVNFGWKAKENGNKVRILPPHSKFLTAWDQMEDVALRYQIHYFRRDGKQTEVSRCLEELKQKCPACETYRAFKKSTDPGLQELAKEIRAADQYLLNILDINNLQQGLQVWAANYTCWDKIMEIVANPQWGNVIDPANGLNFEIILTPGARSRSGHNSYSVMPGDGGQRTTVMQILEAIPGWQSELDKLEQHINPAKSAEEIQALLDEIGFPPPGGQPRAVRPVAGVQPVGVAPVAVPSAMPAAPVPSVAIPGVAPVAPAAPAPVAIPAAPAAVPVAPVPVAQPVPVPVAVPTPVEPARPNVASVFAPGAPPPTLAHPSAGAVSAVHYDPGPDYRPKMADADRPANVPRCYSDYKPQVHSCQPCPVISDCQLRYLGYKV